MRLSDLSTRAATIVVAILLVVPAALAADPSALVREGEDLYRQGAYSEALKKFESALAAGYETPALLYQTGVCHDAATGNKEKALEFKKRAVPQLEKEISGGTGSVDAHYYLSAIYINDLGDPVKGTDVARKGIAILEKPKAAVPTTQEGLFRAGRLYSFLGKDAQAASFYERSAQAAESGSATVDRASLKLALADLGAWRYREKSWAAAAKAYGALLMLDPLRDRDRHQYGLALFMDGRPQEAAAAWKGAVSDELRTELNYLAGVATKYVSCGSPTTSKLAPKPASLDDAALEQKILQAGEVLRVVREKEAKVRQEQEDKEREERIARETNPPPVDIEAVKAKFKAKRKNPPPPSEPGKEEADPWQALRNMGLNPVTLPPAPPESPEKIAAEKDFFFLMTTYVKRGHLIRNFCFENGLVEMIFR